MSIIFILAPLSLLLAGVFVFLFFRAVESGQFQDLETPAHRMLIDSVDSVDSVNAEKKKGKLE